MKNRKWKIENKLYSVVEIQETSTPSGDPRLPIKRSALGAMFCVQPNNYAEVSRW
jgi:hypothetical protein